MNAPPELRIGDADREAAASALGEHFAHGRITREEYDERSAVVWASRTGSDLRPLFVDLPGPHPAVLGAVRRVTPAPSSRLARTGAPDAGAPARRSGRFPVLPLVLVVLGIALLADGLPVLLLILVLGWVLVFRRLRRVGGPCRAHGAQRG